MSNVNLDVLSPQHMAQLLEQIQQFGETVDVPAKERRIIELEGQMSAPEFWNDQAAAQQVIDELKTLKNVVGPYYEIADGISAAQELLEMVEPDDEATRQEIAAEMSQLQQRYEQLELNLALSGPYDKGDIYLSVQTGAGGTDAADWAALLLRMYTNYAQKAGYGCQLIDYQENEEAGIKAATLHIKGEFAYGFFKSEMGTHRLVRMSPFNSSGTRETSFAAVEVTPELPESEQVSVDDIDEKEFRIDTFRASGAGGQHINKTDSAVRITHLATGTVVSCQSERSQVQNRARCWKMMTAKLQQIQDRERLDELKDLGSERGTIGWGHQIRSYVMHPYQMVKDLRTSQETNQIDQVLAGDLQPFIDAYLRYRLEAQSQADVS